MHYGVTTGVASTTDETDTDPRVTSHQVQLQGLASCALYYYMVQSEDASSNVGTGSVLSFTTTSCTGDASVETQSGTSILADTGGTAGIVDSSTGITLTIPADFSTNDAVFQVAELDTTTTLATTSTPSGYENAGRLYSLLALSGAITSVTSFSEAITVMMRYTDAEVSNLTESSLWIYRWDGASWNALSSCVVDTSANTVTCTTTSFSTFGLFGTTPASSASSTASTASATTHGGRRGSTTAMGDRIAQAYRTLLARFEQNYGDATAQGGPTHAAASASSSATSTSSQNTIATAARNRNRLVAMIDEMEVLFGDVPLDAWFAPYVSYVIEEKIAEGYRDEEGKPKGEFGVANPVTYAEMLKMGLEAAITDLQGVPPPRNESAQNSWASPYVGKAESLLLTVFRTSLNVHTPATRGAVIQTLLEIMGLPTSIKIASPFTDVPASHPYVQAISAAAAYGIVEGDKAPDDTALNTFRPNDPINRAEVAKIISLLKEVMGQ